MFKYYLEMAREKHDPELAKAAVKTNAPNWETTRIDKIIRNHITTSNSVLDFGAGGAKPATRLKSEGYNITAYDFMYTPEQKPTDDDPRDYNALSKKYDVVYASNVINVQSSEKMILKTIKEIKGSMKPSAVFICNFPTNPRKWAEMQKANDMKDFLSKHFTDIKLIGGTNSDPIWSMKKK
jgi:2-polyprenyl-3-methyl-5-hydroxy-6-metoxy-1,4-benzoquinol methylase